jgi:N-acetylglucosaminyldiphosphoundecaprenol N-acetyl-beta-D-mannosaminyltransferase
MSAIETNGDTDRSVDAALIEQLEERFSPRGIRRRRLRRYQSVLWLVWVNALDGIKRLFDFVVSSALLLVLAPLLLLLYGLNRLRGGDIERSSRLGRWGCIFEQYSFSSGVARGLPALVNVWLGDMSLIGPRPIGPGEVSPAERLAWKRFNTRPGMLCLWWIRSRTNIAYGTEIGSDLEYVDTQSLMGDLGIALRSIPASLYGEGVAAAPDHVELLGITVNNLTMDEAVEDLVAKAKGSVPSQVCFVNADCANIAWDNNEYRRVLSNSALVLADGIGMKLAGRMLNRNIRQNVNGTDLLPRLCKLLEKEALGIYLLGGKSGVAADVERWMRSQFPELPVRGYHHGYFSPEELPEVIADIKASRAEVLLVAFGVPKQDQWIEEHLGETGALLAMGVGGLFDFYSGRIPRAPAWIREVGMEWFYRFWQEPRRMWRRYFVGNAVFLTRVVRERLGSADSL